MYLFFSVLYLLLFSYIFYISCLLNFLYVFLKLTILIKINIIKNINTYISEYSNKINDIKNPNITLNILKESDKYVSANCCSSPEELSNIISWTTDVKKSISDTIIEYAKPITENLINKLPIK